MANFITGIPDRPYFIWPFTLPAISWSFAPTIGSVQSGTTSVSTVALETDYYGTQTITAKFVAEIGPVDSASLLVTDKGLRIRLNMEKPGTLTISAGGQEIGAYYGSGPGVFPTVPVSVFDRIEFPLSPLGGWQPYSNTPWYEYRDIARAIVSESVSGSVRYRSEWGVKSDGLFSCSNVKRARLFKSATVNPISTAGFNEAAGRETNDVNGTFEEMISAARSVDVITLKATSTKRIYFSIVDSAILSDFTAALTETDGKRMYDVSLPLRHIGFS